MSTVDFIEIPTSPASFAAYSFIGLACLTFLYGIYGTICAVLQFLRMGPRRYFRRVERPKPPAKAMDSLHGEHQMLKLKVPIDFDLKFNEYLLLVFGYIHSLCIERFTKSTNDFISAWFS